MLAIRRAVRRLARQRALTVTTILTLGLGLAGALSVFAVFDGLTFRPLPYPNSTRIVHLNAPLRVFLDDPVAGQQAQQLLAETGLFEERAVARAVAPFYTESVAVAEWGLRATAVSPGFFPVLGVQPMLGRAFADGDRRTHPRPLILSYEVWRDRYGGEKSVLNQTVSIPGTLTGEPWLVVGVMAPGFSFPAGTNIWIPYDSELPLLAPDFALLSRGVDISQIRALVARVTVTPLREHLRPSESLAVGYLVGAGTLLVLICWIQVAAVTIARTADRLRDITIETALGASRWKQAADSMLESSLLAIAASLTAWMLVNPFTALIATVMPADLTRGQQLAPDLRTALVAALVAVTGATVLSLLSLQVIRSTTGLAALRGLSGASAGHRATRLHRILTVAQTGMGVVLVSLALSLFIEYRRVANVPIGFSPDGVFALHLPMPAAPSGLPREVRQAIEQRQRERAAETIEAVRRLPQTVAASFAFSLPLADSRPLMSVDAGPDLSLRLDAVRLPLFEDYFDTLGARLEVNRPLTATEIPGSPTTEYAVVNRTLARQLERFGPVVGQSIFSVGGATRFEIVGVVADIRESRLDRPVEPVLYSHRPRGATAHTIIARFRYPEPSIERIRELLRPIWGDQNTPWRLQRLQDIVSMASAGYRSRAILIGVTTVLGALVFVITVSGSTGYLIRHRARRTSLELALGATPARIRTQILRTVRNQLLAGMASGCAMTIWTAIVIWPMLGGLAVDWRVLLLAAVTPCAVGMLTARVLTSTLGAVEFRGLTREA